MQKVLGINAHFARPLHERKAVQEQLGDKADGTLTNSTSVRGRGLKRPGIVTSALRFSLIQVKKKPIVNYARNCTVWVVELKD